MATLSLDRLSTASLARFGEPVVLADSVTTLSGLFDPIGEPSPAGWPDMGLSVREGQERHPRLWVTSADAAALADGDRLSVRGASYRVLRQNDDGAGSVLIDLIAETPTP